MGLDEPPHGDATDFVSRDRRTAVGHPVHAAVRTVIPAPLSSLTFAWVTRVERARPSDCHQVASGFFRPGLDEPIATVVYKHTWSRTLIGTDDPEGTPLVHERQPIPLTAQAGAVAPLVHLGNISALPGGTGIDADGRECQSNAPHLHQEAPFFATQAHLHRNTPNPPSTDLALRFGFLTVGAGSDPDGRLASSEYRPVCSDTWVFRVQASTPPPPPPPPSVAAPRAAAHRDSRASTR